jgi:hypothetical protein
LHGPSGRLPGTRLAQEASERRVAVGRGRYASNRSYQEEAVMAAKVTGGDVLVRLMADVAELKETSSST